jgi:hypothetical protein
MALPPWITSRQSSRRLRGPSRPSSWAPWPSGQRTIPARTSATTPIAEPFVQLRPGGRVAPVDAADGRGRLRRRPAQRDRPAAGQRMRGRERRMPEPQPQGGQVTIGNRRRHHRQGQKPRPKVVAEAGQGALHRPGRAANVWERLGWPQLGRPAIPPRPAATPPPTRWAHRRPPPHRVAHGLPLPGHRQHKRRPTHRIRNDLIDQIIAATRRSKYATVVGAEPGRPAGSSSLAGAEHAGPGGWSERPGGSRPAV